ncbi:DUF4268 domain-containing protein [Parabacteroides sp. FAFU027]|uniref:DUF4268 domain-containing protein n=1 Tax=Parabacteroides sp. FAFU027 TaxID=2922715 RepID=UPI001FAF1CAD|nr:DUF4268 domain-containing protein [Parabacteroides sp. FAFU027]
MYSKEELRQLKTEFWESFATFCEVQPFLRGRKPMWMLYDTKVKDVELKFDISRRGAIVALEINHRNESDRMEMFERIGWYKEALEKDFPEGELIWELVYELDYGKQVARIFVEKTGIDFHRRNHWGEYFRFMADNMFLLERNFREFCEYLRD